tara:strand:- start:2589 stop:3224 length:636 start_codon:yes stop_codon:yes gene_type:complete
MKELIIIGNGNQARVIASTINKEEIKLIGYYAFENKKLQKIKKKKIKIFKNFTELKKNHKKNTYLITGIGENNLREKIVKLFNKKIKNIKWYKVISTQAIVSKKVTIGKGTIIMPGSIINNDSKIGNHCIINTRSVIEHDNVFKNFSSTGPGIITGGNVKIGNKSFLGMASVIINNIKVGYNTIIGAKSLVIEDCKSNSIYYGSPAKKKIS